MGEPSVGPSRTALEAREQTTISTGTSGGRRGGIAPGISVMSIGNSGGIGNARGGRVPSEPVGAAGDAMPNGSQILRGLKQRLLSFILQGIQNDDTTPACVSLLSTGSWGLICVFVQHFVLEIPTISQVKNLHMALKQCGLYYVLLHVCECGYGAYYILHYVFELGFGVCYILWHWKLRCVLRVSESATAQALLLSFSALRGFGDVEGRFLLLHWLVLETEMQRKLFFRMECFEDYYVSLKILES